MTNAADLFVEIKKPNSESFEEVFKAPFITEKMKEILEFGKICKTFLYDVDLTAYSPRNNI